jgi:cation diffusion facilitator CzcD-associated flavoprotein CzcO
MTNDRSAARFDVPVVGAGQAALAIGYYLARQGRRFVTLDRADSIGAAWRNRWDSLVLFTPRRYDSLPGLPQKLLPRSLLVACEDGAAQDDSRLAARTGAKPA